ncbi:MAG: lytic transglycosylase domain-containing protein [Syntrophales bacterium]|nr:lytic transglycosylase domain-containing protein [Syntrophales bacterium]
MKSKKDIFSYIKCLGQMALPLAFVFSMGILLSIDSKGSFVLVDPSKKSDFSLYMAPGSHSLQGKTSAETCEKRVVTILWRDESFDHIIEETANRYDIEPALVKAIIMAESGYNHMAVSSRGARGLMQLMPRTASELGVQDSFNPEENIDAGVRYFRHLLDEFNEQTTLALAAYNAGSRRVREYQGVPPFPATQTYIQRVFQYYRYFKGVSGETVESA